MSNTKECEKFLSQEYLEKMDAYWRATNYLAAGQLYLLDNPCPRAAYNGTHKEKNSRSLGYCSGSKLCLYSFKPSY